MTKTVKKNFYFVTWHVPVIASNSSEAFDIAAKAFKRPAIALTVEKFTKAALAKKLKPKDAEFVLSYAPKVTEELKSGKY